MKLALITPGTGSYLCGVCMRDNALAKELCRQGDDAVMVPMYLPHQLDEEAATTGSRIFFGGISTFLREKYRVLRKMPYWMDRALSQPWLLKVVAGRAAAQTGGPDVAEMTLSMLRGEQGNQDGEVKNLTNWLATAFQGEKPDVIWISTALQAGLVRSFRKQLGVPVIGFLQGEDTFLDGLGAGYSEQVWALLAERMRDADGWIAPSRYFADLMAKRLGWSADEAARRIAVVPNGIGTEGYGEFAYTPKPEAPVIGYLARMIPAKGLGLLVDAFLEIKKRGTIQGLRLHCAGSMTATDSTFVDTLKARIQCAGLSDDVKWLPNVTKDEKIAFLKSLTVFSVPAISSEAFGLYVLEAMAAGVPVVLPRSWAFPEIIEATAGGVLYDPAGNDQERVKSLADGLERLLINKDGLPMYARQGHSAVHRDYTMAAFASKLRKLKFVGEME